MAHPWDRLPGESAKAFAAFCLYRDLGTRRSLDEASRRYHGSNRQDSAGDQQRSGSRSSGSIRGWAQRWNWRARAEALDEEQEQVQAAERRAAATEMNERHAQTALLFQDKAIERLRQLRPEELKPRDLVGVVLGAAKLERLARGEPSDRVAQNHQLTDVKELTDEELVTIIARGRGRLLPAGGRGAVSETDGPQQPV
ncbi:MAG TPA: hypothetical protein VK395_29740 [Gemmataceae bacterium]|nr:hypothetical protein [Gemmataceae bacterium]